MDIKVIQAFNKQINTGFYGAYLYFATSVYFSQCAMQGFSDYMRHLASEKLIFAQQIYEYLILRNERLTFSKIQEPSMNWINASDAFKAVHDYEENVLDNLENLLKTCKNACDYPAVEFIYKIINKQREQVAKIKKIIFRIKHPDTGLTNSHFLHFQSDSNILV